MRKPGTVFLITDLILVGFLGYLVRFYGFENVRFSLILGLLIGYGIDFGKRERSILDNVFFATLSAIVLVYVDRIYGLTNVANDHVSVQIALTIAGLVLLLDTVAEVATGLPSSRIAYVISVIAAVVVIRHGLTVTTISMVPKPMNDFVANYSGITLIGSSTTGKQYIVIHRKRINGSYVTTTNRATSNASVDLTVNEIIVPVLPGYEFVDPKTNETLTVTGSVTTTVTVKIVVKRSVYTNPLKFSVSKAVLHDGSGLLNELGSLGSYNANVTKVDANVIEITLTLDVTRTVTDFDHLKADDRNVLGLKLVPSTLSIYEFEYASTKAVTTKTAYANAKSLVFAPLVLAIGPIASIMARRR